MFTRHWRLSLTHMANARGKVEDTRALRVF